MQCVTIGIVDDDILEGQQEFMLSLAKTDPPAALGSTSVTTVAIIDDGEYCA